MAKLKLASEVEWAGMARLSGYRVAGLCKEMQISLRQLHRHTTFVFGQSPAAWLDEQRLCAAPELLRERGMVKAVAYELGFKQVSHFSRKFRKRFGVSPRGFIGGDPIDASAGDLSLAERAN